MHALYTSLRVFPTRSNQVDSKLGNSDDTVKAISRDAISLHLADGFNDRPCIGDTRNTYIVMNDNAAYSRQRESR